MNRNRKHITAWFTAALLCLSLPLSQLPVSASEKPEDNLENAIRISSVKDLEELSENCILNSWSQDKIVILEKDLDLSGTDFTPIPSFGGIFLGQGHTISGLTLEGGSDYTGLFRYIQESGEVHDLYLSGDASADSTHLGLALLAGCNKGLVQGCHVSGNVTGGDYVGMLVGENSVNGVIDDCLSAGTLYGHHLAGGIAGMNKGSILNCKNKSNVNTTVSENDINISTLTVKDLFSTENVASITDIGGIAGNNSGVIRACVNNGPIGYQHVGYNIGGIAGSQSGYIEGCVNYGVLNGRKDVGGIAGQMEPSSEIEYLEDTLDKLDPELDKLHDLVNKMCDDASGSSTQMTDQTGRLLSSVKNAQNAVDNIADQASYGMDDFSGRLTDLSTLSTPEPISLDFLDNLSTPSVSPTPSESASETPTESPAPTDASEETPGPAASDSPTPSGSPSLSDILASAVPTLDPDYDYSYDFDKEAAEDELNKIQNNIYNDASDIIDSTRNTLSKEASLISDRISTYRTSLSSSFSSIISDTELLNSMLDDNNQLLLDDFKAISDQLDVIADIITDSEPDDSDSEDIYTDISDEDTEADITGKVMNCINKGKIYGDLNVGGITGSMSRENNLDPEDDLSFDKDNSTLNIRYKERIVIRKSQNYGVIEGKKDCVGGIAGNMTLGSIIDCIGNGDVASEGDMIGGIAGFSKGNIRSSAAKCALSGENQIGGIAGSGEAISDCYSMVEITEGSNYLGSIAGKAELSEEITHNYFVEGCPAGIDGISYDGVAQPIPYQDFMNLDDLPSVYRNIYLTFMADDRIVSTVTLSYGESFDVNKLPSVPEKEGYCGRWEDFDSSSLTFDQTINAVYSEYISTLESEKTDGNFPVALVEGTFETGDYFTLKEMDAYPEDAKTKAVCRKISISGGSGPYTVRYLIPGDMENPQIELFKNNSWVPVSGDVDGSYYVFPADQSEFIFCLVDRPESPAVKIAIAAAAVLLIILFFVVIRLRKKKMS